MKAHFTVEQAIAALVLNVVRTNPTVTDAIPLREQRLVHFEQGAGWTLQLVYKLSRRQFIVPIGERNAFLRLRSPYTTHRADYATPYTQYMSILENH